MKMGAQQTTYFIVIQENKIPALYGSLKRLVDDYNDINENTLYHIFSRKKETQAQIGNIKIYKVELRRSIKE